MELPPTNKSKCFEAPSDISKDLMKDFPYMERTVEQERFETETSTFIETVDFETLNSIFEELIQKIPASQDMNRSGNVVSKEKILFRGDSYTLAGEAQPSSGYITLKWPQIDSSLPPEEAVSKRARDVLKTLAHEATHVYAGYLRKRSSTDTSLVGEPRQENWTSSTHLRTGFSEDIIELEHSYSVESGERIDQKVTRSIGLSLNEAVTENIARQVFKEYLVRTGNSSLLNIPDHGGSYQYDRAAFSILLTYLAEEFKVSQEEIWKGFVNAYLSGTTEAKLFFSELESIFNKNTTVLEMLRILANHHGAENEGPNIQKELSKKFNDLDLFDDLYLKTNVKHDLGLR